MSNKGYLVNLVKFSSNRQGSKVYRIYIKYFPLQPSKGVDDYGNIIIIIYLFFYMFFFMISGSFKTTRKSCFIQATDK